MLSQRHLYGDDSSVSSLGSGSTHSSTISSIKDLTSVKDGGSIRSKSSRCRTLSEMSESSSASQDSASFDTASIGTVITTPVTFRWHSHLVETIDDTYVQRGNGFLHAFQLYINLHELIF